VSTAQRADQIGPRHGLVGYVNANGRQWRVMLRLRLDDDGWWRGRLWFSESGGMEGLDQAEFTGQSPEDLLRQARVLPTEELARRCRDAYDERRHYFAFRGLLDDFVDKARVLNRAAVRAGGSGVYGLGTTRELDRLQREMIFLVEGMRQAAGKEGRATR
jgi:hypothetical protein